MLPVEHTLYAHLCFLKVAARRTNARRSKPARAERARSWLGAGTTVSWWSRAVCGAWTRRTRTRTMPRSPEGGRGV
eukprot:COSAG06_NODE_1761_length_8450_cov_7621.426536_9_plen_76_part_00